ncbi:MAG: hypothetical protein ACLT8H_01390 [Streptococcus parasanguinis]
MAIVWMLRLVGIGGYADSKNPQWFDMLTSNDFTEIGVRSML